MRELNCFLFFVKNACNIGERIEAGEFLFDGRIVLVEAELIDILGALT